MPQVLDPLTEYYLPVSLRSIRPPYWQAVCIRYGLPRLGEADGSFHPRPLPNGIRAQIGPEFFNVWKFRPSQVGGGENDAV
jgi:hypothetical protein